MGQKARKDLGKLTYRVGHGKFRAWKGLNLDRQAGALEDGQLREARNIRFDTGAILCRGGQGGQNVTEDLAWEGLYDASDVGAPVSLPAPPLPPPAPPPYVFVYLLISLINEDLVRFFSFFPILRLTGDTPDISTFVIPRAPDGSVYTYSGNMLQTMVVAGDVVALTPLTSALVVGINSAAWYAGTIFLASNASVYYYNGTPGSALVVDHAAGSSAPRLAVSQSRNELIAYGALGTFDVRNIAGVWGTVPVSADYICKQAVELLGDVYCTVIDTTDANFFGVLKYSSAGALTLVQSWSTGASAKSPACVDAVHGVLYLLRQASAGTIALMSFDGAVWTTLKTFNEGTDYPTGRCFDFIVISGGDLAIGTQTDLGTLDASLLTSSTLMADTWAATTFAGTTFLGAIPAP